jgi:hypothetical protein
LYVGQSFVDDSFSGLEKEELPDLLNHIDEVFPVLWTKWMFPMTTSILQHFPIKSIKKFLDSASHFKKVDHPIRNTQVLLSVSNSTLDSTVVERTRLISHPMTLQSTMT